MNDLSFWTFSLFVGLRNLVGDVTPLAYYSYYSCIIHSPASRLLSIHTVGGASPHLIKEA